MVFSSSKNNVAQWIRQMEESYFNTTQRIEDHSIHYPDLGIVMVVTEQQQVESLLKSARKLILQYQDISPELNNIYSLMLWSPIFLPEAELYFQQILDVIGIEVYDEEPLYRES